MSSNKLKYQEIFVCILQKTPETYIALSAMSIRNNYKIFDIAREDMESINVDISKQSTFNNQLKIGGPRVKVKVGNIKPTSLEHYGFEAIATKDQRDSVKTNCALSHIINLQYTSAGYLLHILQSSRTFRRIFCKYCRINCQGWAEKVHLPTQAEEDLPICVLCILVKGRMSWVDYKWNYRLCSLLWRRVQLDDSMNWLNTLGGGYSALGDTFTQFALKAGEISVAQLQIAQEMGDTPTLIRCKLYYSLSLMQRGFLRQAKYLLRHQYQLAKPFHNTDRRLINTCIGLWTRLQYYYKNRTSVQI